MYAEQLLPVLRYLYIHIPLTALLCTFLMAGELKIENEDKIFPSREICERQRNPVIRNAALTKQCKREKDQNGRRLFFSLAPSKVLFVPKIFGLWRPGWSLIRFVFNSFQILMFLPYFFSSSSFFSFWEFRRRFYFSNCPSG
jgi:hypothetical protein